MLLAGDVGGTKALVGLFQDGPGRPKLVDARAFASCDYASFEDVIAAFLAAQPSPVPPLTAASFGVAGPIINQVARLTNVPWVVDASVIVSRFRIPNVTLLNDLQAMAYSVAVLEPGELAVVQPGHAVPTGNAALIAAGTGLGEALLHYVGGRFIPSPTEGGHADFAPRTADEVALLRHLTARFGRGEYEHVISGPGLSNVHAFTHPDGCAACGVEAGQDAAPSQISAAAIERRCPSCVRALEIFVSVYGAETGNLALRSVATAGVFIGGGIAPKILPALQGGGFIGAFCAKGPMEALLSRVPVSVILDDRAGLLGAAVHAGMQLEG
jgi:glucokinase